MEQETSPQQKQSYDNWLMDQMEMGAYEVEAPLPLANFQPGDLNCPSTPEQETVMRQVERAVGLLYEKTRHLPMQMRDEARKSIMREWFPESAHLMR